MNREGYLNRAFNMDITHRCLLQCPRCPRQIYPGIHKKGTDLNLTDLEKVFKEYTRINLCGTMGDPIYHPKFHAILRLLWLWRNRVEIRTNGSGKSIDWWKKSYEFTKWNLNIKDPEWIFGLDGLPKDSHKYRVNQNGEQVWEMMKLGASLGNDIHWQYIVFKYNQDDIDTARMMAQDNGINFILVESSSWIEDDPLKPDHHYQKRKL